MNLMQRYHVSKSRLLFSFAVIVGFLFPLLNLLEGAGGPPELLSYQSYLVDADGNPLGVPSPTNYDVQFRIYTALSGGNLIWAEQQTITIDNGYFSVLLGEGSEVGSEPRPPFSQVFSGNKSDERFIGMNVRFVEGGEFTEILPRLRLLTSPYAFLASQARSVVNATGQPIITAEGKNVTVDGTVRATKLEGDLSANHITGVIPQNRIPDLDQDKLSAIIDLIYPVGSFYIQFPDANSNAENTAFPAKYGPAELFGGTWEEQWANESIFFRTGGEESNEARSGGLQQYATKRLTGSTTWFQIDLDHKYEDTGTGVFSTTYAGGGTDSGNSRDVVGKAHFDSARQSRSSEKETRPKNRKIKVWKRVR